MLDNIHEKKQQQTSFYRLQKTHYCKTTLYAVTAPGFLRSERRLGAI